MAQLKSVLDNRIYGVVYITGLYGVGKTTLATTAERPELTAIVDFDLKFKAEAERLGFWYRSPEHVQDVFNFDLPAMTDWFRKAIADIPEGTTSVVFDNASQLETLLGHVVGLAPEKYGVNPANARSGSYGGVNPGVGRLWKNVVLHLQRRGVRVIFVISHIGSPWIDGKPVLNKFRGKGNKALQELANLSLVLVRQDKPYPAGIILKEQFAQRTFTDDGWTIQRVFPLRFPRAEWKSILGYFDTPANFETPETGEVPNQNEVNMYGELFTKEQVEFIKAVASGQYIEDGDAPPQSVGQPELPKPELPVEPKPATPKTNGQHGKVGDDPMSQYWLKVRELGVTNGKDILAMANGDAVKATNIIMGVDQTTEAA